MDTNLFERRRSGQSVDRQGAPFHSLQVLVVDDEPAIREVLAIMLATDGHTVLTACDSEDALRKLELREWDIVMTDRAMPGMGGDELAARIKDKRPLLPVILLTGYTGPMESAGPHARMIDGIIKKPFTGSELREGIERALLAVHHAG